MKALFVKDLRIIMTQKRYGVIILIVGSIMVMTMTMSFDMLAGYFMMIAFMLAIRTIDYDAMENGMPFLMTMPAGREKYALEKYILTYGVMVLVGVLLLLVFLVAKLFGLTDLSIGNFVISEASVLCVGMLGGAVMFPLYLKYQAEKRQLVVIVFVGICVAVGALLSLGVPYLAGNPELAVSHIVRSAVEWLQRASGILVCTGLLGIALIANTISVLISRNIVRKKEF